MILYDTRIKGKFQKKFKFFRGYLLNVAYKYKLLENVLEISPLWPYICISLKVTYNSSEEVNALFYKIELLPAEILMLIAFKA